VNQHHDGRVVTPMIGASNPLIACECAPFTSA
jgi:hypothetical protein